MTVIGYVVIEELGDFDPELAGADLYSSVEAAEKQRDKWNVAACAALSDVAYGVAEVREIEADHE